MGSVTPCPSSRLFQPLQVGAVQIQHRIAMAPLTRFRSTNKHVPRAELMAPYYAQRGAVPGTLLVSEATFISDAQAGYLNAPGLFTAEQVAAWRPVTAAVHAQGSFIFAQLWAHGRATPQKVMDKKGLPVLSSSAVPIGEGAAVPREMTLEEIKQTVQDYAKAAKAAVDAGFDGVEIHGANGYLIDQFLQSTCNHRTDTYGGSIANRSRFCLEVVAAVVAAVGADRTAIRLSPWSRFQAMRMPSDADVVAQFGDVITKLNTTYKLAYLHLVAPRITGGSDDTAPPDSETESLDFAYDLWDGVLMVAGGFTPETARRLVDEERKDKDVVVAFGRHFISNPDLPFRVRHGVPLTKYDRDTFYNVESPVGYVDWPFSKEWEELEGKKTAAQL